MHLLPVRWRLPQPRLSPLSSFPKRIISLTGLTQGSKRACVFLYLPPSLHTSTRTFASARACLSTLHVGMHTCRQSWQPSPKISKALPARQAAPCSSIHSFLIRNPVESQLPKQYGTACCSSIKTKQALASLWLCTHCHGKRGQARAPGEAGSTLLTWMGVCAWLVAHDLEQGLLWVPAHLCACSYIHVANTPGQVCLAVVRAFMLQTHQGRCATRLFVHSCCKHTRAGVPCGCLCMRVANIPGQVCRAGVRAFMLQTHQGRCAMQAGLAGRLAWDAVPWYTWGAALYLFDAELQMWCYAAFGCCIALSDIHGMLLESRITALAAHGVFV